MTKDKQIIEIKECIDAVYGADCAYFDIDGFAIADEIYNAGYRKASEVAREIFEEIEEALEQAKEIADIRIRELAPHTYKVMRETGKLYHKHDSNAIAELKKKYTEGEG